MRICIDSNQFIFGLISDNRHFLDELHTKAFEVVSPEEFLQHYYWSVIKENQ